MQAESVVKVRSQRASGDLVRAIINIKVRHAIRRIVEHESEEGFDRLPDDPPRLLVIIRIHRIPLEAHRSIIENAVGDQSVAPDTELVVDIVESVAEHRDDS